jgi:hypothetical protein
MMQPGNGKAPNPEMLKSEHAYRAKYGAECLAAALEYRELGWCPLVVCPPDHVGVGRGHGKNCKSPGKAPWGEWREFQTRLPTESELRAKWHDLPNANVGLALGPVSGFIAIDIDGAGGEQALQRVSGGGVPETYEFSTPGGGRRLLYAIPEGMNLRTTSEKCGVKQEIRFQAKGSQTVMPPSRHPNGGRYAWRAGHRPREIKPALAPDWLLRELTVKASPSTNRRASPVTDGEVILEGGRNDKLTSLAGSMRCRGMTQTAIEAALLAENAERCNPPLTDDEVRGIAKSVARYSPSGNGTVSSSATVATYPAMALEEVDAQDLANSPEAGNLDYLPLLGHEGYFVKGWSHLLAGYPRCGKTELLAGACREWLAAGCKILFFTEESRSIWHKRTIQSPGLWKGLQLVFALGRDPHDLLGRMMAGKEDAVIVDTIRNLQVLPCDENDNAAVARAISPWVAGARERKKTLTLSHHTRKGAGEHGEGIAGGHALLGAVDIALEIRRDTCPTRRLIKAYARLIQPEDLLYQRDSHGVLVAMGDPKGVQILELRRRVVSVISDDWLKTTEVWRRLNDPRPSDEMVRRALAAEAKAGTIDRDPAITVEKTTGKTLRWRRKAT